MRRIGLFGAAAGLVYLCAECAHAAETTTASNAVAINTVWVLLAAFLVFFMQAGFAMVEAGFTRAKNACNIMMKNLMDFSVGSIAFWAIGFGVMFGADKFGLFGTNGFFLTSSNMTCMIRGIPAMTITFSSIKPGAREILL